MENKKIADIIIKQIHLFFISGLYGILLGLWYEFFRTLRKNFVHKNKMVHLEDVIFCFTAAIGLFILFQVYNQGMVRFYCLVGLECGAVFYFLVLSEVIGNYRGNHTFSRKSNCEKYRQNVEKYEENR